MTDIEAIQTVNQDFYRAFERKNFAAMGSVWSSGIGVSCIHPGRPALKGWEAVGDSWEQIFKGTDYLEIETELVSTEVNGDLAYIILIETVFQVIRGQRMQARSLATNIFERMGQRWYLVHHHGSPLMP